MFDDVQLFDMRDNVWFPAPLSGRPPAARAGHSSTVTPAGKVVIFGGVTAAGAWCGLARPNSPALLVGDVELRTLVFSYR